MATRTVFAIYPGSRRSTWPGRTRCSAPAVRDPGRGPEAGPVRATVGPRRPRRTAAARGRPRATVDTLVVAGGDGVDLAANGPRHGRLGGGDRRRRAPHRERLHRRATCSRPRGCSTAAASTTHWDHARAPREGLPGASRSTPTRSSSAPGASGRPPASRPGIDLALALVEEDRGAARRSGSRAPRDGPAPPGGQSQYAASVWSEPAPPGGVRHVQERIHREPGADRRCRRSRGRRT